MTIKGRLTELKIVGIPLTEDGRNTDVKVTFTSGANGGQQLHYKEITKPNLTLLRVATAYMPSITYAKFSGEFFRLCKSDPTNFIYSELK